MLDAETPFRERQHPAGQLTIDHDLILPEDVDGLGFGEWMLELARCGTQASGS